MKLLIATRNNGKVKEIEELFRGSNHRLLSLNDFSVKDVEETGSTFEENAALKATGYAIQTGVWTLADDSGLEVEALNNTPGVFSARYAGVGSTDEENNGKLLSELSKQPDYNRKARFVCVVALSDPNGKIIFSSEGVCLGTIADSASGTNGFGYDSLFVPIGHHRTFGLFTMDEKNQISHRSKAFAKIVKKVAHFT
jgi:XTP/dITP diphosphohydrolase